MQTNREKIPNQKPRLLTFLENALLLIVLGLMTLRATYIESPHIETIQFFLSSEIVSLLDQASEEPLICGEFLCGLEIEGCKAARRYNQSSRYQVFSMNFPSCHPHISQCNISSRELVA